MGRRARRRRNFIRKYALTFAFGVVLTVLTAGIIALIFAFSNPYGRALRKAGVKPEDLQWKKGVLTLTFEGDALGILSCRDALSALRAEQCPETVEWILTKDGENIHSGTVQQAGTVTAPSTSRVETLNEDLTVLKLKYALAQNGMTAEISAEPTVGLKGKTLTVTLPADPQEITVLSAAVPAAVESVNAEGGGIVRCDLLFTASGGAFAAASYDFVYGDTLFSSAFREE